MKEVFHQTPPSPIPSVLAHIKEWEIFSYFFLSCHYMFFCNKGICYFVSSLFVFASKRMALTNGRGRPSGARMPQEDHISSGSVGPGLQRTIPPLQWAILQNTTKYVHFFLLRMDWLGLDCRLGRGVRTWPK